MPEAVDFYAALGARVLNGSRDGDFTLLQLNVSELSLLAHPPNPAQDEGQVELNFVSSGPLSELEGQLRSAGVQIVSPTSDERSGRQLQVASPDGLLVKDQRAGSRAVRLSAPPPGRISSSCSRCRLPTCRCL